MRFFDPIHGFIHFDKSEEKVIYSIPVQRLRDIYQLAMAYMVYPGGCHRRFEHSLGVVELATRIYRHITRSKHSFSKEMPQTEEELKYWEEVVRMAALCHDIGHLPFSHAAEEELLPEGSFHEHLTVQIILSDYMKEAFESFNPPLKPEDVAFVATGERFLNKEASPFEKILHEMIAGDVFGADRIDYLVRDSYHTGLKYGNFDYPQLITHLSLDEGESGVCLAVDADGVIAAESLLLARYFMFSRLYWHPSQIIQTLHLNEYLSAFWEDHFPGRFSDWHNLTPEELKQILSLTDGELISDMRKAILSPDHPRQKLAERVLGSKRFKLLLKPSPIDKRKASNFAFLCLKELEKEFGKEAIRYSKKTGKDSMIRFPVISQRKRLERSLEHSRLLENIPKMEEEFIFVEPLLFEQAQQFLNGRFEKRLQI